MKEKLKKILKRAGLIAISILLIISIYDVFRPDSFELTVEAAPSDATIKVNDITVGTGRYQGNLKRGEYSILATKEGYNSEVRNITLDKSTLITLNLTASASANANVATLRSTPLENAKTVGNTGLLYSVDSVNGNLVKTDDNRSITLYNGQVRDYSISANNAVILDYRNNTEIIVLNTTTGSSRRINLSDYAPIISVAISDDSQTIYFLAKFDIEKKNPTLYSINSQGGNATNITDTRALKVEYWKDNTVILFENVHALDQGSVHVYDTQNKAEVFTGRANTYIISPNKDYLALQTSRNITIVNRQDYKTETTSLSFADFVAWKDGSNLTVLRNRNNSVEYATISLNPIRQSSFIKIMDGKQVRSLFGVNDGKITFQDITDSVFTLDLPQ